ncbi:MAG: hypothetical protein RIQ89_2002 [Bacteroidota bacterium]|jgi:hypothetical protein
MLKLPILFALAIMLCGCAQQANPTGGKRDIQPPKLMTSTPEQLMKNFKGQELILNFDEYIQVKELTSQLLISPPLRNGIKSKIQKRSLILTHNDTLNPNTTYTISFGNAIADLNEGNVLQDLKLVFATGPTIDTASIQGLVADASTNKGEAGVAVLLFESDNDSSIFNAVPNYYTRTIEGGLFNFQYISPQSYTIYALKEKNNNFKYDDQEELIGKLTTPVPSNSTAPPFSYFKPLPKLNLIKCQSEAPGKIVCYYNQPTVNFNWQFLGDTSGLQLYTVSSNARGDTTTIWYANNQFDSLSILLRTSTTTDTVNLRLSRKNAAAIGRGQQVLQIKTTVDQSGLLAPNQFLSLHFSFPIAKLDTNKLMLRADSLQLAPKHEWVSDDFLKLNLSHNWVEGKAYKLWLLPGMATDLYGNTHDTIRINFTVRPTESYGTLLLKPQALDSTAQYAIQLLNESGSIVQTATGIQQNITWNYVEPGIYHVKIIVDTDANGNYTTGSIIPYREAEKVFFYKEPIIIRANWDVEISLDPLVK